MTFVDHVRLLNRAWPWLAIPTAVSLLAAAVFTLLQPTQYHTNLTVEGEGAERMEAWLRSNALPIAATLTVGLIARRGNVLQITLASDAHRTSPDAMQRDVLALADRMLAETTAPPPPERPDPQTLADFDRQVAALEHELYRAPATVAPYLTARALDLRGRATGHDPAKSPPAPVRMIAPVEIRAMHPWMSEVAVAGFGGLLLGWGSLLFSIYWRAVAASS